MIRRPRIIEYSNVDSSDWIDVGKFADALDDDVIQLMPGADGWAFFQFADFIRSSSTRSIVRLGYLSLAIFESRSIKTDDPVDWFADIIAAGIISYIELSAKSRSNRLRYSWISPFWNLVRLWMEHRGAQIVTVEVSFVQSESGTVAVKYCSDGLAMLASGYRTANAVKREAVVTFSHDRWVRIARWTLGCLITTQANGARLLISGPLADVDAALASLTSREVLSIFIAPDQHVIDRQEFSQSTRNLTERSPYADAQWFGYHRIILDASIALDLRLPPYVLLEVFDWLPYFDYWPRLRKIELIESVMRSIRRLPDRDTRAVRPKRNKE